MDFSFSKEQEMFRQTVRRFVKRECSPQKEREFDEQETFPDEIFKKMAAVGFMGLLVPEEFGGSGGKTLDGILLLEELAYGSSCAAGAYAYSSLYGTIKILHNGTDEQKHEYLPLLASGMSKISVACTEPDAGTGIGAIRTTAVMDGDRFVINGTKMYINNAHVADYLITACVTDGRAEEFKNMSSAWVQCVSYSKDGQPRHPFVRGRL